MPLHNCFFEIEKVDFICFTSHLFEANYRNSRLAKRHPKVVCANTNVTKMPKWSASYPAKTPDKNQQNLQRHQLMNQLNVFFHWKVLKMKLCTSLPCVYHLSCVRPETHVFLINWFIHSLPSSVCSLTRASITDVFFRKPPDPVFHSNSGFPPRSSQDEQILWRNSYFIQCANDVFVHAKRSLHFDAWQPLTPLTAPERSGFPPPRDARNYKDLNPLQKFTCLLHDSVANVTEGFSKLKTAR